MCRKLSEDEYNALETIASKTKMDCWFSIIESGDEDLVKDLENDEILTLGNGLSQFSEGIVDPLSSYGLSDNEINAVINLFKEFDIPFEEENTI